MLYEKFFNQKILIFFKLKCIFLSEFDANSNYFKFAFFILFCEVFLPFFQHLSSKKHKRQPKFRIGKICPLKITKSL